ncbi:hypothetical protein EDB19DRAFT_1827099 [Suillus lakei]|nr:hypothetical protein EDB19DRAFT_1827099 [Suillus lakei]
MRRIVGNLAIKDVGKMETVHSSVDSTASAEAKIFTSANAILAQGTEGIFKIPRSLLNLAKAKVHIPLTLLMNTALRKMHEDPSCIKLKKGLVLSDPKMMVMDTSSGFPPETTLTADVFFEASSNFLSLLKLIADNDMVVRFTNHCQFSTYKEHWSEVKIDSRMDCDQGNQGGGGKV